MSQLALECKIHLITLSHQTIYEKIEGCFIYFFTICTLIINNLFSFFVNINFLILSGLINSFKLNTNYKRVSHLHQDAKKNSLNPYYITGFVDGEGCFLINIYPKSNYKAGYLVSLAFKLKIHSRDINLLESIKNYFNIGNITHRKDGYVDLVVSSIKDIKVLIDHFDSFPLLTQK
jgi:hypothetical protein